MDTSNFELNDVFRYWDEADGDGGPETFYTDKAEFIQEIIWDMYSKFRDEHSMRLLMSMEDSLMDSLKKYNITKKTSVRKSWTCPVCEGLGFLLVNEICGDSVLTYSSKCTCEDGRTSGWIRYRKQYRKRKMLNGIAALQGEEPQEDNFRPED